MSFEVKGRVTLDGSGFSKSLGLMKGQISELKGQIGAAFTVVALEQFGKKVVETVSRIKDLSKQYQVTTTQVQQLDHAAKEAGLTFEDFGSVLDKVGVAREAAMGTSHEAQVLVKTFEDFGLALEDLKGPAKNLELVQRMAAEMARTGVSDEKRAEFLKLAGKHAGKLVETLQNLNELSKGAVIIPDSTINTLDAANKRLEHMKETLIAIAAGPLGQLVGFVLKPFDQRIGEEAKRVGELYKRGRDSGVPEKDLATMRENFLGVVRNSADFQEIKDAADQFSDELDKRIKLTGAPSLFDKLTNLFKGPPLTVTDPMEAWAQDHRLTPEQRVQQDEERKAALKEGDKLKDELEKSRLEHLTSGKDAAVKKQIDQFLQGAFDAADFGFNKLAMTELGKAGGLVPLLSDKAERPQADNLARIGGFIGASGNPMQTALNEQKQALTRIQQALDRIVKFVEGN